MRLLLVMPALFGLAYAQTTLDLTAARPSGRTGKVNLALTAEGLRVTGEISGGSPSFATTEAQMAAKDHVEIWIAPESQPELPAVGWGNQFGMETEKTEKECKDAACRAWFRAVPGYRSRFRRLFVRQFQLAPGVVAETFARPAYDEIVSKYPKADTKPLNAIAPTGTPQFTAKTSPSGYAFEALIPWEAFPPLATTKVGRLRVMVDAFSSHAGPATTQPYSTTSAARKYGDPATMNLVSFSTPQSFRISSCEYPLKARGIYFDDLPAWFLPKAGGLVHNIFVIENTARGYQYEPGGLSPVVRSTKTFERKLGDGEFVCGPDLATRRGGKTTNHEQIVEEEAFEARKLADGTVAVKAGPVTNYSEFGSGQCGACPHEELNIYRIKPDGKMIHAFEFHEVIDGGTLAEADLKVTADWSRVTVARASMEQQERKRRDIETFCLTGDAYKTCGTRKNVTEPRP